MIEDVVSGRAAVGIFHFDRKRRGEIKDLLAAKDLVYRHLAYVEPHIVLSQNHPLLKQRQPVNLHTLAPYGVIRYLGQYDDLLHSLLEQQLQETADGPSKVIYLSARESLMRLISASDFYSIGIHDFELQNAGYQAVSIPIPDCDFMFEFGYIHLKEAELSAITQEFLQNVRTRLN